MEIEIQCNCIIFTTTSSQCLPIITKEYNNDSRYNLAKSIPSLTPRHTSPHSRIRSSPLLPLDLIPPNSGNCPKAHLPHTTPPLPDSLRTPRKEKKIIPAKVPRGRKWKSGRAISNARSPRCAAAHMPDVHTAPLLICRSYFCPRSVYKFGAAVNGSAVNHWAREG